MEEIDEKISMKERAHQIKEEMNSGDRKFEGMITLGDLDDAGVSLFDFFDLPGLKKSGVKFTWNVLIKITNVKMVKGKDISRDTPFLEGLPIISDMLQKGFLGKGSEN
jgi:hypothetical protein